MGEGQKGYVSEGGRNCSKLHRFANTTDIFQVRQQFIGKLMSCYGPISKYLMSEPVSHLSCKSKNRNLASANIPHKQVGF